MKTIKKGLNQYFNLDYEYVKPVLKERIDFVEIKWNFKREKFNKAIKGINNRILQISFDLKLMDCKDKTGMVLDADLYKGRLPCVNHTKCKQL